MGDPRTNNPNHLPEPDNMPGNVGDGPVKDPPVDPQKPDMPVEQPNKEPPVQDPNPSSRPAELPGQNEAPIQDPPINPEDPGNPAGDPPPMS